jgi:plastocyanin
MGGINSNNIVAGGSFTVVFDDTSTPKLTELTGTVFTFGLAPAGGKEDKHKPKILTDPADQTVTVGADATFSVTVKPDLPVTYQWHCDGKKGPVIAGATQATLVLHNVTMADADKYVVVVTNRNGSTTSKKATLTVLPQAPVIVAAPQSQAVSSGDNVTFTVMATSEISPDYQWYFKSKKIGHAKSASLTLSKVELSDAGDYSVVVSNDGSHVDGARPGHHEHQPRHRECRQQCLHLDRHGCELRQRRSRSLERRQLPDHLRRQHDPHGEHPRERHSREEEKREGRNGADHREESQRRMLERAGTDDRAVVFFKSGTKGTSTNLFGLRAE